MAIINLPLRSDKPIKSKDGKVKSKPGGQEKKFSVHFSEEFHIKTDKGNKKTIYIQ
jgi:hypothetical protein